MVKRFFEGTIAVVGATNKQERFGFKIYDILRKRHPDLKVIPVNPSCNFVGGVSCFDSIDDIADEVDTVVMIVNPEIGIEIVKKACLNGIKKFWFQPGAESEEIRDYCEANDLLYSIGMCLLFN